jgi:hypothetical protein
MALSFQRRFDEAIAEGRRAIELDPLSPQVLLDATVPFIFQRNAIAGEGTCAEGNRARSDALRPRDVSNSGVFSAPMNPVQLDET